MFAEMWEGRSGGRQKICLKAVEVVAGGQSLSAGDGERDDGREGEGDPGPGGHGLRQNLRVAHREVLPTLPLQNPQPGVLRPQVGPRKFRSDPNSL